MTGPAPAAEGALLEVAGLTVTAPAPAGPLAVVDDVSFAVRRGETLGLVGESGAGKSLTAYAVLRLLPPGVRIASGRVLLEGRDLVPLPEPEMREVRGGRIGMVFQEPMTALNPAFTVGFQLVEAVRTHRRIDRAAARDEARWLLERVAMPEPERRLRSFPHELSGGQRQRVVIAMALACRPALVLADEPTSALDVTVQARILALLRELRDELGLAIVLITHDLAVVAESCDRALVMAAGRIVEEGPVPELFRRPRHPYTQTLLAAAEAVA